MPNSPLTHPHYPPDSSAELAGYDDDFVLWVEQQVELLRLRKFDQLDLENVIEEFSSMGSSRRHELRSRLQVLLMHLLKCQFQPEHKSRSWLSTIYGQRASIADIIEDSPSLQRFVAQYVQDRYKHAAELASIETGLPLSAFPTSNPYSIENLLDENFVP